MDSLNFKDLWENIPFVELEIPSAEVFPESGFCFQYRFKSSAGKFFGRLTKKENFAVFEDGKELPTANCQHNEIRELGQGRFSVWQDQIYFSSLDGSDPRSNGRRYSVKVPQFVAFLERMPAAGIQKFGV